MTTLERYQKLANAADELKQRTSRARGALDQQLARLRDEHESASLPEAKRKHQQIVAEAKQAREEFEEAVEEFENKWREALGL